MTDPVYCEKCRVWVKNYSVHCDAKKHCKYLTYTEKRLKDLKEKIRQARAELKEMVLTF